MDSPHSNLSIHGSAPVAPIDRERYSAIKSTSDPKSFSGRDLASLYAALDHEAIAALAHRYWQERGCPEGSAAEDWFRAEQDFHNKTEFGCSLDYLEVGLVLLLPH
jgi:hypothetical protein